jgi:hypothetical protein
MRKRLFAAAVAAVGLSMPASAQTVVQATVYRPNCTNGKCPTTFQSVGVAHIPSMPTVGKVVRLDERILPQSLPVQPVPSQPTTAVQASYLTPVVYAPSSTPVYHHSTTAITEQKTDAQATTGVMQHVGQVPAGLYEGVGFSTLSPQHALDNCCHSRRPRVAQSVRYGFNRLFGRWGWFATILAK